MSEEKELIRLQIEELRLKLSQIRKAEIGIRKTKFSHTCPYCGETWMGWKEEIGECHFCKRQLVKKEGKREKEVEADLAGLNLAELERSSPECRYGQRLNCLGCGSSVITDKQVILGKEWDLVKYRCGECHATGVYRRKKQVKVEAKKTEFKEGVFEDEGDELSTEVTEEMDSDEQAEVFGIES